MMAKGMTRYALFLDSRRDNDLSIDLNELRRERWLTHKDPLE